MDHAVCAIGRAVVASISHKDMIATFDRQPSVAIALWRETLIDAAIFREAITNNSARSIPARTAHLFYELFYRARGSGLTKGNTCQVPVSFARLNETLGMSIATVNRTMQTLRNGRMVNFKNGELLIRNWQRLVETASSILAIYI